MKHEFTDSEITVAADQAVDTASYYRTIPIDYLKAFLDALPEPEQDDFQRGGVILDTDDVRKGDRVLIRNLANNLYEVTVTHVDKRVISWKGWSIDKSNIGHIYLLDRPVTYPDPDYHPVVISNVGDAWLWDAYEEHYIEICGGGHRGPGDFGAGWVPGKVVADDEM